MDRNKIDNILTAIDLETAPPLSKRAALDILEEVASDIEGRIDALKDEIEDEEE